jgi:cbb3-type cytochrome c oxidase subunit III
VNVRIIAACLLVIGTLVAVSLRHPPGAAAAPALDGKAIFASKCSSCHQVNGAGNGPYPPLAGNPDVTSADTAGVIATLLHGRTGPITVLGRSYSGAMPAWREQLSNAEIAAVITYVRGAWKNSAAAVSEDQVALAAKPVALTGAELYAAKCIACHQAGGVGNAAFPPLAGNPDVTAADTKSMIATIVNGRSGALAVAGKTYDGKMPAWKGQLSSADIAAVATYIRASWGNAASGVTEQAVANAGPPVSTAVGAAIYAKRCAACHQANGGGGGGGAFPALAKNGHVNAANAAMMLGTIEHGKNVMPSWKGQLSPGDIAAVATYIRSAWGNSGGPVTESDVSAIK